MRSYFNKIAIKGGRVWKICALVGLGIFLTCCVLQIYNIQQPVTATAGSTITITTRDSVSTNIEGANVVANYVAAILLPKGFAGASNTTVTYTSTLGNGNMELMPSTVIEPSTAGGTNLNYAQSMLAKFGIGNNLVNDLEWVVFRSVNQISIANGDVIVGNINFQIKVGADGNTTIFKPAYVICESQDGLNYFAGNKADADFAFNNGARMTVNGPGDINDLCDPQLTSFNPAKVLQNDIITITYNEGLDSLKLLKGTSLYLCVDTVYTSTGQKLTGFCSQTVKTQLTETSATSNLYTLTFWPTSLFKLTSSEMITEMAYHIIDANGNSVGLNDSSTPFIYKFSCD
jgi:hypothetical protein